MMGAAETPWFHLAWTSNYGGRRTADLESKAPGRRALFGGDDAPMPEDEPQFGTLWEHVANAGLSIRNYGEGLEAEGSAELDGSAPEGQRLLLNAPVPLPTFSSRDQTYPTFNLGIPDQYRYAELLATSKKISKGRRPLADCDPAAERSHGITPARRRLAGCCLLCGRQRPGAGSHREVGLA